MPASPEERTSRHCSSALPLLSSCLQLVSHLSFSMKLKSSSAYELHTEGLYQGSGHSNHLFLTKPCKWRSRPRQPVPCRYSKSHTHLLSDTAATSTTAPGFGFRQYELNILRVVMLDLGVNLLSPAVPWSGPDLG